MRFNILVATSFFVTLAAGLVVPANTLSSRDLEVRDVEDTADILVREPIFGLKQVVGALEKLEPKYHVPAGGPGKPAQSYTRKEVKKAVNDARTEATRLAGPGVSNRSKKNSPLKTFNNNDHHAPKKLGFKKTFPLMKGTGKEYPLPNKSGNPGKGPARVILHEKNGKLKLKGVVAHDQSRAHGTTGANDHFRIRPSINPFRRT